MQSVNPLLLRNVLTYGLLSVPTSTLEIASGRCPILAPLAWPENTYLHATSYSDVA